jgi:hypothetical protein
VCVAHEAIVDLAGLRHNPLRCKHARQ